MRVYSAAPMNLTLTPAAVPDRSSALWLTIRVFAALGFAGLMGLASGESIRFPIPGTPVPVTLQSLVAILAGATLGARLGLLSMLVFLIAGVCGAFAYVGGPEAFLRGSTAGYLIGFLLAQPLIALVTRIPALPPREYVFRMFLAGAVGHVVILLSGTIGLAFAMNMGLPQAFELGFLPFLPGSIVKIAAGMAVGVPLLAVLRRSVEV